MPHIAVSMYPGRGPEIKEKLAAKLKETLVDELGCPPEVVTVSVSDVQPENWKEFADSIPAEDRFNV